MAPLTRSHRNSALAKKITTLQLTLQPLVPLPSGPPHPAFPKSLFAFHLLTEEELDSLAHYYHQSTPGPWTLHYPACMNWDKDFLKKCSPKTPKTLYSPSERAVASQLAEDIWLQNLMKPIQQQMSPHEGRKRKASTTFITENLVDDGNGESGILVDYSKLSDGDRIQIKRRKVGKFIGLVGMETPAEEIAGRIQASLDRAVESARRERLRDEEMILRRRKI